MKFSSSSLLPLLSPLSSACPQGIHIIVARASLELPGEGSSSALANSITSKIPNSDSTGLDYPALPAPLGYNYSVQTGVENLERDVEMYVKDCGTGKGGKAGKGGGVVLIGYDQGAEVVGDYLAGVGENEGMAVKGVILLSDPTHVVGQSYDRGTATTNGIYPRSAASLASLNRFAGIIRSYCDAGDTVCASGNNSQANRGYLDKYQTDATDFVVGLYEKGE